VTDSFSLMVGLLPRGNACRAADGRARGGSGPGARPGRPLLGRADEPAQRGPGGARSVLGGVFRIAWHRPRSWPRGVPRAPSGDAGLGRGPCVRSSQSHGGQRRDRGLRDPPAGLKGGRGQGGRRPRSGFGLKRLDLENKAGPHHEPDPLVCDAPFTEGRTLPGPGGVDQALGEPANPKTCRIALTPLA
jgi:hypothetical protein